MTAGVPAIPLHGARHRYATIMLEDGVPLHVVSAQLGHSNDHDQHLRPRLPRRGHRGC